MRVQRFPAPGEKVSASDFIVTGGGCAANAAVAVARLKGRAVFSGPLGGMDDAVSNRIVADLEAEGIDCGHIVRVRDAVASVSLILLDAEGEKSIATRRGNGLNDALPADPARLVADADAVLVDNRFPDFAMTVCKAARERGIPVVIDLDQATSRTIRCWRSARMSSPRRKRFTAPPARATSRPGLRCLPRATRASWR